MGPVNGEVARLCFGEEGQLRLGFWRSAGCSRGTTPIANEKNLLAVQTDSDHAAQRRGCLMAVMRRLFRELALELFDVLAESWLLGQLAGALVLDDDVAVKRILNAG
jgi:hypothetical protein